MKALIPSVIFTSLLLIGCGSSKSDQKDSLTNKEGNFSCDLNSSLALKSSLIEVSQNTLNLSNKIINDMNVMLEKMDRMNDAIDNTMDISSQTLKKIAEPFNISDEGKNLFTIDNSTSPYITIKKPLTKKYILVSSPNRFFPDTQSVKTLFNDGTTLSNALQKAFDEVDNSKNLYLTILQIESNTTLTNLTNGVLIKNN